MGVPVSWRKLWQDALHPGHICAQRVQCLCKAWHTPVLLSWCLPGWLCAALCHRQAGFNTQGERMVCATLWTQILAKAAYGPVVASAVSTPSA